MPQPRIPLNPQDPEQAATQKPDEDTPPALTEYVKVYRQAGKLWLDTVVENQEQAYDTLFDTLQQLGDPHIDNLDQANREQVFRCIRDRTGRFLSKDEFTMYVEQEEEKQKPRYNLKGECQGSIKRLLRCGPYTVRGAEKLCSKHAGSGREN